MRPIVIVSILAACILGSTPARGQPSLIHSVRSNDNYAKLALHYYGRSNLELHLRTYNRRHLYPGIQIVIPASYQTPLPAHQTLEQFAQEHLHDARRAEYLRIVYRKRIQPGMYLKVPPSLAHPLTPTDTWANLAVRYYGDNTETTQNLIRAFNPGLHDLELGKILRIPLDLPEMERNTIIERISPGAHQPKPPPMAPQTTCPDSPLDLALERFAAKDLAGADASLAQAEVCEDPHLTAIVSRQRGVVRAMLAEDTALRTERFYQHMSLSTESFLRALRLNPDIRLSGGRPPELVDAAYHCAQNLLALTELPNRLWPCPLADWALPKE